MPQSANESMSTHLVRELEAMVVHLSGSGVPLPAVALAILTRLEAGERPSLVELGQAHAALAEAVAPALPRTLALLSEHRPGEQEGGFMRDMFSLPLTYRFIVISVVTLIGVLLLSALGADELQPHPDLPWAEVPLVHALLARAYIVGQAALGGAFNILWTANGFVTRGTYDPRHDASYLIRFVMGIISGVLLAGIGGEQLSAEQLDTFPIGLLALVGGFSASLLHRFLQRSVGAVESLLSGDSREALTQAQEQARSKLNAALLGERLKLQTQLQQLRSVAERDPSQTKPLLDQLLAGIDATPPTERPRAVSMPAPMPAPMSTPVPTPTPAPAPAPDGPSGWRRPKLDGDDPDPT